MVLCASESYLNDNKIFTTEDLNNQQWLLYNSDNNKIKLINNKNKHYHKYNVETHISSNNTQILKQACIKGLGIACLPKISISQALKTKALVPLLREYTVQQSKDVYMVYPSNKYLSAKMIEFIKFIKQQGINI